MRPRARRREDPKKKRARHLHASRAQGTGSMWRTVPTACIQVHEDADKAGHNRHDTSNTKRFFCQCIVRCVLLVRIFMSVALCHSGLQRVSSGYRTKLYLYREQRMLDADTRRPIVSRLSLLSSSTRAARSPQESAHG